MSRARHILRALFVMAVAIPVVGHAQAVTTFDGTYKGVSNTPSGTRSCVAPGPTPPTLTIKDGNVQYAGGSRGDVLFTGTVTAQGLVTTRGSNGSRFNGKIEGGKLSGGNNGGGDCTIMQVWQKQ
jgi:hypothetical protein